MVQFGAIKFCRIFLRTILVSSCGLKNKRKATIIVAFHYMKRRLKTGKNNSLSLNITQKETSSALRSAEKIQKFSKSREKMRKRLKEDWLWSHSILLEVQRGRIMNKPEYSSRRQA